MPSEGFILPVGPFDSSKNPLERVLKLVSSNPIKITAWRDGTKLMYMVEGNSGPSEESFRAFMVALTPPEIKKVNPETPATPPKKA
jgi:hypothetical protein